MTYDFLDISNDFETTIYILSLKNIDLDTKIATLEDFYFTFNEITKKLNISRGGFINKVGDKEALDISLSYLAIDRYIKSKDKEFYNTKDIVKNIECIKDFCIKIEDYLSQEDMKKFKLNEVPTLDSDTQSSDVRKNRDRG